MKDKNLGIRLCLIAAVFSMSAASIAQQSAAVASTVATGSAVPKVVNYSGTLSDLNGKALTSLVGVTFSLYKESQGGAPLWLETQNVQPSKSGYYSVTLCSTTSHGLPEDVFVSGEARWLGVQVQGQNEQPRVLLVAVPYALKSRDAETLGGLPASAFLLAAPPSSAAGSSGAAASSSTVPPPPAAITGTGTAGFLPDFTGAATIGNSAVFQSGVSPTAKIGINTNAPTNTLDVHGGTVVRGTFVLPATGTATAVAGKSSQPENLGASAFNSGTSTAVAQTFQLKAEPVGNNTASASGSLNFLFGQGTSLPTETGLSINSKGQFTFAAGQTFPGTGPGTVTSVGSGAGLTGGPITGSGTLSIAGGGVTNAMLLHPSLTVSPGTDLTGGGAVALGGTTTLNLDTTKVPTLAAGNTFAATQTFANGAVTGNTITAAAGTFPFLMNSTTCCNTGTRMVWAHSPAFPNWGIYYDDSVDFMHIRTGPGGEIFTVNFGGLIGINNAAPTQALDVVGNVKTSGTVLAGADVDASGNANITGFVSAGGDVFGNVGSFASDVDLGGSVNASGGANLAFVNSSGRAIIGSTTAGSQILIVENNGSGQALQIQNFANPIGGFTEAQFDMNGSATFFTDALGNTTAKGTKSAAVPLASGAMVKVFSTESPEVWFEDYGFGQLAGGTGRVVIDPSFAQTASLNGYHVFVTPKGDCKGLYVTNETNNSFEVRELGGGQSSVAFDYRIVAHRKGYETVRLPAAQLPRPHATQLTAAKLPAPERPKRVLALAPEPTRVNPQSLYRAPAPVQKQVLRAPKK